VGQEHVTRTLANAIKAGRLAHSFLFCGPRGVGKTTTARILAKCLNCEKASNGPVAEPCNECPSCREIAEGSSLDVLEIDGASSRGIDEIREIRENVRYAPSSGRAKVYIIDEVHMLTKEAFNALLKTLEEPPPSVYFVFATTEVHKVPMTICSRCQRYEFHRVPTALIAKTLRELAEREKLEVEGAALELLARAADGALRDAQGLLDQLAAVGEGKIDAAALRSLLGEAGDEKCLAIIESLGKGDAGEAFSGLQELLDRGMDPSRIGVALTQTLRDLLVVRAAPAKAVLLGVRADVLPDYERVAAGFSSDRLTAFLATVSQAVSELKRSARPRLALEVALARLTRLDDPGELAALAQRVEEVSRQLSGVARPPGAPAPARSSAAPRRGVEPRAGSDPSEPKASATALLEATGHESLWGELLGRVRERKVMLASFLEHGSPSTLDDHALTALFENNYYEGMVTRRENLAIIQEELARLTGRSLAFRARVGGGGAPVSREGPVERPRPKDLLQENPGLERLVRELGGELLPGGGSVPGGEE
jgi:DNA polymerase-3 subunit gamma/tau